MNKQRGVFEKVLDSGEWWIRYVDAEGRYRGEKVGTKGMAIDLYRKRKTEACRERNSRRSFGGASRASQNWPTMRASTRRPTTPATQVTSTVSRSSKRNSVKDPQSPYQLRTSVPSSTNRNGSQEHSTERGQFSSPYIASESKTAKWHSIRQSCSSLARYRMSV